MADWPLQTHTHIFSPPGMHCHIPRRLPCRWFGCPALARAASPNRTLHVGFSVYMNRVEVGTITFNHTTFPLASDLGLGGSLRTFWGNLLNFQMKKVRLREVQCPAERPSVQIAELKFKAMCPDARPDPPWCYTASHFQNSAFLCLSSANSLLTWEIIMFSFFLSFSNNYAVSKFWRLKLLLCGMKQSGH